MKPKRRRLTFVLIGMGLLAAAAALVLAAFRDSIVFFYSPSEIHAKALPAEQRIRVGGLVEEGSLSRAAGSGTITFRITDLAETIAVTYTGILPDLFREGQGVVAEGRFEDDVLKADEVLAKHDENYMPPEVADALKKSGQWEHMKDAMEDAGQIPKESAR
ncbi:MAG: cytochrome c maturation protein CcmE [Rhodospirillales bacterium]|jgi:cytochrome c-type biogenesis protein CcmE|nr:cytochrome c maturation protein CcmE [Rhodospirillales bacterium]